MAERHGLSIEPPRYQSRRTHQECRWCRNSFLLVVVDALGPEGSLKPNISASHSETCNVVAHYSHLISIAPRESLIPDIHEWILGLLLDRRLMGLVFPMFLPKPPGVHAADDEAGDDDEDGEFAPGVYAHDCQPDILLAPDLIGPE